MIRVLIAAQSAVVRAGLAALLKSAANIEVTGTTADWTQIGQDDPDVVLIDWDRSPDESPPDPAEAATAAIILLADEAQRSWIVEALRSGVRGVLPRDASPGQIVAAIEAAAAGLAVLDAADVDAVLVSPRPARLVEPLSPREIEVLNMLAEGSSNKAIAHRLGISEHTVKFHVTSIMAKLNAGSRTEAVTLGIRQGLVML